MPIRTTTIIVHLDYLTKLVPPDTGGTKSRVFTSLTLERVSGGGEPDYLTATAEVWPAKADGTPHRGRRPSTTSGTGDIPLLRAMAAVARSESEDTHADWLLSRAKAEADFRQEQASRFLHSGTPTTTTP